MLGPGAGRGTMTATAEQRGRLDLLDLVALLSDVGDELRAVITRIANRARTADEADDLKVLIRCRGRLGQAQAQVAAGHPDGRMKAEG